MRTPSRAIAAFTALALIGCSSEPSDPDGGTMTLRDARIDPAPDATSDRDASSGTDAQSGGDTSVRDDAQTGTDAPVPPMDGAMSHDGGSDGSTDGSAGGNTVVQLSGGRYHSCARTASGAMYCWGQGAYRQLGGNYGWQGTARRIESVSDALSLECGHRFTCAIRPGGAVWCWGDGDYEQSGPAETVPCGDSVIDSVCVTSPQPIPMVARDAVELALGEEHACVRLSNGTVTCWGDNRKGQVGTAQLVTIAQPTVVQGIAGASQVVAGDSFSCARIGTPGTVKCWGANGRAQLGNGSTADAVPTPQTVGGLSDAVEIVAGGDHACARRMDGTVVCWGYNYLGSLGNGTTRPTNASTIQNVLNVTRAVQLAAGDYHTCARIDDGTLRCWGYNSKGQVGDGTTTQQNTPVSVPSIRGATHVMAGFLHTCAIVANGAVMCWGDDFGGQLGVGRVTRDPITTPVQTQGLP